MTTRYTVKGQKVHLLRCISGKHVRYQVIENRTLHGGEIHPITHFLDEGDEVWVVSKSPYKFPLDVRARHVAKSLIASLLYDEMASYESS